MEYIGMRFIIALNGLCIRSHQAIGPLSITLLGMS